MPRNDLLRDFSDSSNVRVARVRRNTLVKPLSCTQNGWRVLFAVNERDLL